VLAGCGGGTSGDDNTNDAGTDLDAWTFDCPQTQPTDYACIHGRIRNFVTDEPVAVPEGAMVGMYAALDKGDFPNEPVIQVSVQPDGRFIFPSVEQHIVQEFLLGDLPNQVEATYHLFSLRLDADVAGYRVPDNRYGLDFYDTELTFYVFADSTIDAWAESWAIRVPADPELGIDTNFKTVLGLCYGAYPYTVPPTMDETTALGFNTLSGTTPSGLGHLHLHSDRLHFPDPFSVALSGMTVFLLRDVLPASETIFSSCNYFSMDYPTLGQVGPMTLDDSSPLLVIHGPMLRTTLHGM